MPSRFAVGNYILRNEGAFSTHRYNIVITCNLIKQIPQGFHLGGLFFIKDKTLVGS